MDIIAGKLLNDERKTSNTIRFLGNKVDVIPNEEPQVSVAVLGLELLNSKNATILDLLKNNKPCPRLTWEKTLFLGIQVLRGIYDCHSIGILHRDIKADNIGILAEPNDQIAVLFDFGFARLYTDQEGEILEPRSISSISHYNTEIP